MSISVEWVGEDQVRFQHIRMNSRNQLGRALMLVGALAILTACQWQRPAPPKNGRYTLQGEVIALDQPKQQVTVRHGAIAGLMPAMTMVYDVQDGSQMKRLWPGDRIKAELVVQDGKAELQNITVLGK